LRFGSFVSGDALVTFGKPSCNVLRCVTRQRLAAMNVAGVNRLRFAMQTPEWPNL
jgi:hypothetical protein